MVTDRDNERCHLTSSLLGPEVWGGPYCQNKLWLKLSNFLALIIVLARIVGAPWSGQTQGLPLQEVTIIQMLQGDRNDDQCQFFQFYWTNLHNKLQAPFSCWCRNPPVIPNFFSNFFSISHPISSSHLSCKIIYCGTLIVTGFFFRPDPIRFPPRIFHFSKWSFFD